MNLPRCLARSLLSSNPTKRVVLFRPAAAFSTEVPAGKQAHTRCPKASSGSDTEEKEAEAEEKEAELGFPDSWRKGTERETPKPSEIPYQVRVANSVHLVGKVGLPVQLQASPDGVYSAVSVLVQEKTRDSPQFWVPVIFQGDLAQIAACHLNESDLVYVTGQLSGDSPSLTINNAQTNIQVLARSLSFVQKGNPREEGSMVRQENMVASICSGEVEEPPSIQQLWDDLLSNPHNWWDNRLAKRTPTHADFKHKESGQLLWINELTPDGVRLKLDSLSFWQGIKSLWTDLIVNPQMWWDYRMQKLNGSVSPKHPDFKQKGTLKGLWLDRAPEWVLLKIDGLEFSRGNNITNTDYVCRDSQKGGGKMSSAVSNKQNEKEKLWKSLVENPNMWWDNRSSKLKQNHPDFKHKDSGEALWLGSSMPSWVLPNLPQLKDKQKINGQ